MTGQQFAGPVGPWGWRLLQHRTMDNSTGTIDFDLEVPANATCTRHMIIASEIVLATNDRTIFLRFSDDSLQNFEADAGDYDWINHGSNDATVIDDEESGGPIDTAIMLWSNATTAQIGNASGEFSQWTITIDGAMNAAIPTHVSWFGSFVDDDGAFTEAWGAGAMMSTVAHEGVRFMAEDGNITSGEVALLGLMLPA